MTASPNLIGIGSGLVAAVLFASLANNSALAVALFYLTPLPVLLAGMGWGLGAALLSMLTASLLLVLVQTLPTAIAFALYIGLPGLTLTYLFLLHRDGSGEARPQETSPSGQSWDRMVSARPHHCLGVGHGRRARLARAGFPRRRQ